MESGVPHPRRIIRTTSNVLWPHEFPGYIPDDDERDIPNGSGPGLAVGVHG